MASSKAEALANFKSVGRDPATVDVAKVVPERALPKWIGQYKT